jgi:NAD(P)-dependent dehydrogenase (short-subunit alcohol dehydrogenase family)
VRRFDGKVALVTGAAQGIGRATAERLGLEGGSIALVDVNEEGVITAAAELRKQGIDAVGIACDVGDERQVADAFAAAVSQFGGLDVVHAHAGILLPGNVVDETIERFELTLRVNVTGIFLTARAAIPHLLDRGGGAIVNTGSTAGIVAEPNFLGYCTSKAAVNHMTRQLALDYAAKGIRVNAVAPGWIDTSFSDPILEGATREELDEMVRAAVPMARMGSPAEVAAAVAFLASDDASFITGHCLVLDGGGTVV